MKDPRAWVIPKLLITILVAIISITIIAPRATSAKWNKATIESLDKKRTNVLELITSATSTSIAVSALPGDTATPIADKLADISEAFLIVLCAIYLEKYLLVVTGFITFYALIPLSCLCFLGYFLLKKHTLHHLAVKIFVFGLALFVVVPFSVKVTDTIESVYGTNIEETLAEAESITEANDSTIEESTEAAESTTEASAEATTEEKGFWQNITNKATDWLHDKTEALSDSAEDVVVTVKDKVTTTVADATAISKTVLNNFIEALALMIVTSCIVPILILLLFVWLIKIFLGLDLPENSVQSVVSIFGKGKKNPEE